MLNLTNYDWILLLVFLILIIGDKITTYICILGVQNNFPATNASSVERNIMAKWLIEKFGNFFGNVIMIFVSMMIVLALLLIGKFVLIKIGHPEWLNYFIYGIIIIYVYALCNNIYYALKYNKVI